MFFKKQKSIISTDTANERLKLLETIEKNIRKLEVYDISRYDKQNNKFTTYGYDYQDLYECLTELQPELNICNKEILSYYNFIFFEIMCLPSGHEKLIDFEQLYKCIASIYSKIIDDYTEN